MKRPKKPPRTLDVVRLLGDFALSRGLSLNDPAIRDAFADHIDDVLATDAKRPTVIQGMRTQAMFAFVAQALRQCKSISEEDAGDFAGPESEAKQRPDYRVVTLEGETFLVEVKNHYQKANATAPLLMKREYMDKLTAYAALHGVPLRFAVYWARWNIWTLVRPTAFAPAGKGLKLTMEQALTTNEMITLGDARIGLEPPIALRFYADPTKPRDLSPSGEAAFTIQRTAVLVNEREVSLPLERKLALYFMFFGDWGDVEQPCHVEHNHIIWVEFRVSPQHEARDEQTFDTIGAMSGFASNKFKELTRSGDEIAGIFTDADPTRCPVLPDGYKGDVLKLWLS